MSRPGVADADRVYERKIASMRIVQVRFPGSRRLYSYDAGALEIAVGDVLVTNAQLLLSPQSRFEIS